MKGRHIPLFKYHCGKANLRVPAIEEIKPPLHVPMSHLFVQTLIGDIRRALLDHTVFWPATDLQGKVNDYQRFYNQQTLLQPTPAYSGPGGVTPAHSVSGKFIDINGYRCENFCRGRFQLAVAA